MTDLFCAKCGQKNEVVHRALWPLLKDSFGLLLVADGKLWRTLSTLLFLPGRLAERYVAGKRAPYLKPFSTYFWVSALVFAALTFDTSALSGEPSAAMAKDTLQIDAPEFDTALHTMETSGGWQGRLASNFKHYQQNTNDARVTFNRSMLQRLPRIAFFMVPMLALMLKVLWHKRAFSDHLVLALHAQTVLFLLLIPSDSFALALALYPTWLLLAARHFYSVSWLQSVLKISVLLTLYLVALLVLTIVLMVTSLILM